MTWTLKSKHIDGKAADLCSRSRGYDYPEFYAAVAMLARVCGLQTITLEGSHVELPW